jgi:hypothetical protein
MPAVIAVVNGRVALRENEQPRQAVGREASGFEVVHSADGKSGIKQCPGNFVLRVCALQVAFHGPTCASPAGMHDVNFEQSLPWQPARVLRDERPRVGMLPHINPAAAEGLAWGHKIEQKPAARPQRFMDTREHLLQVSPPDEMVECVEVRRDQIDWFRETEVANVLSKPQDARVRATALRKSEHFGRGIHGEDRHIPTAGKISGEEASAAAEICRRGKADAIVAREGFERAPESSEKTETEHLVIDRDKPAVWSRGKPHQAFSCNRSGFQ